MYLLPLLEARMYLSEDQNRQVSEKIDSFKNILLTKDEETVIKDCFNRHKEEDDLYRLMYLVLSETNVIAEARRSGKCNVEYRKFWESTDTEQQKEGEACTNLSGPPTGVKKTTRHITLYEKIGVIGSYIDLLRTQCDEPNNSDTKTEQEGVL